VRLLLNSTAEAIYGVDLQDNCTFANPSCLRMLGYANMKQLLGKNMHPLIHHSYADGTPMPVEDCRMYEHYLKARETMLKMRSSGGQTAPDFLSNIGLILK
jgi:PAS domain S-box-containing protein